MYSPLQTYIATSIAYYKNNDRITIATTDNKKLKEQNKSHKYNKCD